MDRTDGLVAAQVVALAGVLAPGRPRWPLPAAARLAAGAVAAGGGTLALAGAAPLRGHLTPRVRPRPGAPLVTTGVYRHLRNPVYAGLTLAATGTAVLRRRPLPLASALALAAVLGSKSVLEERALAERFGATYQRYAAATPRFLPRLSPLARRG
ncbi:methyltransferase family protein [Georgenia sp. AZ-5]|uniref:methyltransferase family protein n=1 Tax=Georgenia sp. AZ-5 TaxID=3367526 RepID=UPI00375478CC